MHKLLYICAVLLLTYSLSAQTQRGIKGQYNTENYPEVSFVWNSPNPTVLEKNTFILTDENDKEIDFHFSVMPKKNTEYKKSILFLWEDMYSHSKQSDNARKLLIDFFNKTSFDQSTAFNVAVFNRKSDKEKNVLKPLSQNFTSDAGNLASLVANYEKSTRTFGKDEHPKETDLYLAINEGVNMLKKEPSDRVGIIVVITAGLNMKAAGASTEMETVRKNAVEAGIPVYAVKYHQIAGNAPEMNSLAESTYGQTILLTDNKVDETVLALQNLYKKFDENCYGQDYKFSFTTTAKRDGKPHRLRMSVDKVPQLIPPFTAPSMTFGLWVKENLWLFILLILLLVVVIALAVWFILRSAKKRKMREEENKAQLQQEIDRANQDRLNWENKQKQKEEAKQREEAKKALDAENNRLMHLMHVKNMYPRLQCSVDGLSFTHTINQVVTKIGRNEDNDVVLPHQTVSGFHAEIRFNGAAFDIFNKSKSYTQGIIVNGQFFQQCTLKSGDKIGLGEAVITFYV